MKSPGTLAIMCRADNYSPTLKRPWLEILVGVSAVAYPMAYVRYRDFPFSDKALKIWRNLPGNYYGEDDGWHHCDDDGWYHCDEYNLFVPDYEEDDDDG